MRLNPNRKKIVEAILFVIEEAARNSQVVTQYEIVKSIFIADMAHLEKFGRPITFDNYNALECGPVPSEAYDMLKPDYNGTQHFGSEWPFWDRVHAPEISPKAYKFVNARRAADQRRLSQTDVAELREGLAIVKRLGFGRVKDWTHELQAYVDAWKPTSGKKSFKMDYKLLVKDDADLLSDIVHASKYM